MTTSKTIDQAWKHIGLSYLISWLIWIPLLLGSLGLIPIPEGVIFPLAIIATFGPTFAAFYLIRGDAEEGAKDLLKRAFDFKSIGPKWYLPIFLLIPLGAFLAHVLNLIFFDVRLPIGGAFDRPWEIPFILLLSIVLTGPLAEEFGWRGYTLERLQTKYSALSANLVLAFFWAFWHFPLFFITGAPQETLPFWLFFLTIFFVSIIIGWIQINTGKSLVPALILHGMINTVMEIFPLLNTQTGEDWEPWLFANIILALFCVIIVAIYGKELKKEVIL